MHVVDTNVLVYAADTSSPDHDACKRLLESWRRSAPLWHITWGILYEFLRIVTHPRVFANPWSIPDAWRLVEAVVTTPSCQVLVPTSRHFRVAAELFNQYPHARGNLAFDARTVVLMREHGVRRIYTRDADFHRFGVEVVDPAQPEVR